MPRHIVPVETALRMTLLLVDVDLDAQVALDAGHRIDDDALAGIVEREAVRRLNGHGSSPSRLTRRSSRRFCDRRADGGDAGVDRDRAGDDRRRPSPPTLSAFGLDRRNALIVGQPVVERALVPEGVLRAADAAVAGLDRERDAVVPAHGRAGVVGGRALAAHLVEAVALARALVVPVSTNWPASKCGRR